MLLQKGIFTLATGPIPGGYKMFIYAEDDTSKFYLMEFLNAPSNGQLNVKCERPEMVEELAQTLRNSLS